MKNYTFSHTSRSKALLLMALLVLFSAANALAQAPWNGEGTEQSPYLITTTDELEALADSVNSGTSYAGQFFRLNADLTYDYDTTTQNNHTVIGRYNYIIGNHVYNRPFSGTFDGNNHTISGIRISENYHYKGLFGYCRNSTVKNLILIDAKISGNDYVGGIVGYNRESSIENCQVANDVIVSGDNYVGGIVGYCATNSSIENCQVANNVNIGGSLNVGGIVGRCYNSGSVENCHVANNVTVSGTRTDVGGIVGKSDQTTIEDCQVANNVTICGTNYVSTIVGENNNSTNFYRNYYHGCTVNGVANATDVGTNNGDITENNGAVPGYLITFGEHITSAHAFTTPAYGEMPETTYQVAPSGDTITLGHELADVEVAYYVNRNAIAGNTFIMPAEDVNVTAVWTDYTIHTAADWELFCDALQDNDTYNRFIGDTVRLAADISVTRMAGSSYHDFMGTFDGQGHTLTVAYGSAENPISEEYAAPFRNLENGAVIRNLHVDGHIYTSNKFASGLAGCQYGTVNISNCRSSVIIHSSKSGDGTHGGIVATQHATLTISGCVFDGRLLTTNGTTLCSGLVGYRNSGTCTLSDCLYAPATDVTLAEDETYIINGATFCRNYSGTPANCYYTETLGTAQGKQAHSIIPGEGVTLSFAGEATEYDVSGLSTNGVGLSYLSTLSAQLSTLYAGNGDQVSLNLIFPVPEGFSVAVTYTPEGGTATELTPINGVYSFTMPDANVIIDAITEYIIHDATEWNIFCDALQDNDTYNRFIGDTVRLAADISVTRMAGSSTHDFMGTFDGQGHTLTITYGSAENPITEDYAAPFRNVENGCVIENLHVDGTITTANKYAAGIIAQQFGVVTIRNCTSSVTIQSSVEGDGTHGGLVGVKGNSNNANLTIEGCTFNGKIVSTGTTATTSCGGFVGWRSNSGSLTITNSLYAPTTDNNAVSSGATFARNWTMPNDANCYYTETLGTVQGKQAHSITPGEGVTLAFAGETTEYNVSGLSTNGIGLAYLSTLNSQLSTLYAGNEDVVSLNLDSAPNYNLCYGFTASSGILSGTENPYTLTMPDTEVVINAIFVTADLTVNDSTATISLLPIMGSNVQYYSKSQFIFPAADLAAMQYGTIDKLTFYASETDVSWGDAQFEVYIKEVDYTTFESATLVDWMSMDKVMNAGTLSVVNHQMEVILDEPYQYLGGNLMIGFLETTRGSNSLCHWYIAFHEENVAIYGYEYYRGLNLNRMLPKTTFHFISGEAPACPRPSGLVASDVTTQSTTLNWTGNSESYNVMYRTAAHFDGIEEIFRVPNSYPTGWTCYRGALNDDGTATLTNANEWLIGNSGNNQWSNFDSHASINLNAINRDSWLVTLSIMIGDGYTLDFDLAYTYCYGSIFPVLNCTTHRFAVLISTDNMEHWTILREWNNNGSEDVLDEISNHGQAAPSTSLDDYVGQTVHIAFYAHSETNEYPNAIHIDNVKIGLPIAAGEWQTITVTETTANLTDLIDETLYEVKVQGNCGEEGLSIESIPVRFTTSALPVFAKDLTAYTENGGWHLIASPVDSVNPSKVTGMTHDIFDLYWFNQNAEGDEANASYEWRNYKQDAFNMAVGQGYLYAHNTNINLTFKGVPYSGNGSFPLVYDEEARFPGWNLVGNPFTDTAYLADGRPFYTMNDEGSDIIVAEVNSIAPMEGVFVIANDDGETITFTTTSKAQDLLPGGSEGSPQSLILNISRADSHNTSSSVIDRAIIRFGKGSSLPKFQMRNHSTRIYIPQNGKDYAVVNANRDISGNVSTTEIPVNFKAAENGEYTLTVSTTPLSSLLSPHLIDYLTGTDINLLATPSYTFKAQTTDDASRFKLVFKTNK